jgi:hypothetical protein
MDAMDEGDGRLASPAASQATPTPQFTPRPSQGRFELSKANRSEGWSECWTGVVGHAVHMSTSPGGSKYKGEREAKEALRGCDTTPSHQLAGCTAGAARRVAAFAIAHFSKGLFNQLATEKRRAFVRFGPSSVTETATLLWASYMECSTERMERVQREKEQWGEGATDKDTSHLTEAKRLRERNPMRLLDKDTQFFRTIQPATLSLVGSSYSVTSERSSSQLAMETSALSVNASHGIC